MGLGVISFFGPLFRFFDGKDRVAISRDISGFFLVFSRAIPGVYNFKLIFTITDFGDDGSVAGGRVKFAVFFFSGFVWIFLLIYFLVNFGFLTRFFSR